MERLQRDELTSLVNRAATEGQDSVTLEIPPDLFGPHGEALDLVTALMTGFGYQLTRLRADGDTWVATYEKHERVYLD